MQELRSDFVSRRASCVIIGRHPDAPREVRVACRQLIGILLLADCCQQLKIRVPSLANKLFSPSEFEAAAGCSKGKNWKVINCLGIHSRPLTGSAPVHLFVQAFSVVVVASSLCGCLLPVCSAIDGVSNVKSVVWYQSSWYFMCHDVSCQ